MTLALSSPRSLGISTLEIAALAFAYVVVARLGLAVDAIGGLATLVWPPTGLALATLAVRGRRLWPGVALGALVANLGAGAPAGVAVGIAVGNTLEALLGALALERVGGFQRSLGTLRSVAALVVLAGLGSTVVSATIGAVSMLGGGVITPERLPQAWLAWWVGDMLGDLVVAPLLLTLAGSAPAFARGRAREGLLLGLLLVVTVVLVFGQTEQAFGTPLRQPYLVMPLLIWAAVRFGPRGAALATFAASAGAIWGTAVGHGPLANAPLHERLLELQGFMAVAAITFLILSAVTAERHRLLEHEQDARAESERAVRVRDDFLAVASHELRTPLTPLKLQLEGLGRALEGQDPRILERVERAVRQTGRLARLAEGLLDVSQLAAGHLELDREDVDVSELLLEVVEQLRDDAVRAGSQLSLSSPTAVRGRCDRLRTSQAIANLLANAIKYGRGQPIEVELREGNGSLELSIRDHGLGIEPEAQERIFQRFERAASAKDYGGLGLGLYVAREIARAHTGDIRVTSAPGKGSTFTLALPQG